MHFLQLIATTDVFNHQTAGNAQEQFDLFYATALELLDLFYPERTIMMTTCDPDFVTPQIKALLRRKNRLVCAGRVEEAGAMAKKVGDIIKRR